MKMLKLQYHRNCGQRNYQLIDQLCSQLSFFRKFSRQIRLLLYQNAGLSIFDKQDILFEQDEKVDFIYVILRGCCDIFIKSAE